MKPACDLCGMPGKDIHRESCVAPLLDSIVWWKEKAEAAESKLAAAEARLVQYEAEAEERRLELNVVSAAIFAVKNRGESAAYDGLRDRVADLMTFRLTVRKEKGTRT